MPQCPRNFIAVPCEVAIPFFGRSQQGSYFPCYTWLFCNDCFHDIISFNGLCDEQFSLRNPFVFCERGFSKEKCFLMVLSSYPSGFSRKVGVILPLLLCFIFRRLLLRFQRLVDVLGCFVGFPVGIYGNLCFVRLGRL